MIDLESITVWLAIEGWDYSDIASHAIIHNLASFEDAMIHIWKGKYQ
jgi:hypothetical protein